MAVSKLAKSKDNAHIYRMKNLKPKQRFKTLSKADQYIIIGRTLADILNQKRRKAQKHNWSGHYLVINPIKADYIERDPTTGQLTDVSIRKIKRVTSNAVKRVLGKDAMFCLAIEEEDEPGSRIQPHVHLIAIKYLHQAKVIDLQIALLSVSGDTDPDTIYHDYLSKTVGFKRHKERVRNEADFRRTAGYDAKNDQTRYYRSKSVIEHLPEVFEKLKVHYRKAK